MLFRLSMQHKYLSVLGENSLIVIARPPRRCTLEEFKHPKSAFVAQSQKGQKATWVLLFLLCQRLPDLASKLDEQRRGGAMRMLA
jgi:hypothetical protein